MLICSAESAFICLPLKYWIACSSATMFQCVCFELCFSVYFRFIRTRTSPAIGLYHRNGNECEIKGDSFITLLLIFIDTQSQFLFKLKINKMFHKCFFLSYFYHFFYLEYHLIFTIITNKLHSESLKIFPVKVV